ncbi:MAG: hypothetical protein AB1714_00950 [Acidobacteriota bacterium]
MPHRAVCFPAILTTLVLVTVSAPASDSDPADFKWEVGIAGVYKKRCTFPVKVTANLDSQRAARMEAVAVMANRDRQSRTVQPLRICRAPFDRGDPRGGVSAILSARLSQSCNTVQLMVVEGSRTISRQTLDLEAVSDRVVCVLTQDRGRFDVLGSLEQLTHLCVEAADIPPNGHLFESVDALIVDSFDLGSLDKPRLDAINLWILSGGVMILTAEGILKNAGADSPMPLADIEAGPPASAVPPPAFLSYLDLRAPVVPIKSVPRLGIRLPSGWERIIEDPMGPWLARMRWGFGWIYLDTTRIEGAETGPTLAPRELRRELWQAILSTPPLASDLTAEFGTEDRDFYNVPREAQVSGVMSSVLGFLSICLIVLGPLNYMVLKKLDRREYILATVPLVAVMLAAGAYVVAWSLRGSEAVVRVANLTVGVPGQNGVTRSYLGYLAPDTEPSEVHASNPGGFAVMFRDEIEGAWREADRVGRHPVNFFGSRDLMEISNLCMNKWAMRFLRFDSIDRLHSAIKIDATLSAGRFSGHLFNGTPMTLEKAHFLTRYHSIPLGDLASGATAEWSLDPTTPSRELTGEPEELRYTTLRRTNFSRDQKELLSKAIATYPAVGYAPALVYAFAGEGALRVKTGNAGARCEGNSLGITAVPYRVDAGPGSIPMGFNSVYVSRGTRREPTGPHYAGDDNRDALEFDLPIETSYPIAIERLKVHLGRGKTQCGPVECPPPAPARIHLYDWARQEYVQVGISRAWEDTIDVATPGRFVGLPGARIRVRIERAPGSGAAFGVPDLTVPGGGYDEPPAGALEFHYVDVSMVIGRQPGPTVEVK